MYQLAEDQGADIANIDDAAIELHSKLARILHEGSWILGADACVWAPRWSAKHSRSYGWREVQAQACADQRGPG